MGLWNEMLGAGRWLLAAATWVLVIVCSAPSFWMAMVAGLVCGMATRVIKQAMTLANVLSDIRADLRGLREDVETMRSELAALGFPEGELDGASMREFAK